MNKTQYTVNFQTSDNHWYKLHTENLNSLFTYFIHKYKEYRIANIYSKSTRTFIKQLRNSEIPPYKHF